MVGSSARMAARSMLRYCAPLTAGRSLTTIVAARHTAPYIAQRQLSTRQTYATQAAAQAEVDAEDEPLPELDVDAAPRWADHADALDPRILRSLSQVFRYETMTPVQNEIVQRIGAKTDLLVRSRTGTGKTLAFLIPAVQRALELKRAANKGKESDDRPTEEGRWKKQQQHNNNEGSVLVVSPTRELAKQIAVESSKLTGKTTKLGTLCVVGGDDKRKQVYTMRRSNNDIVVGTPGRLIDLLESEAQFRDIIGTVHTVILDEADTLLEMGFKEAIDRIMSSVGAERTTYMFSATLSKEIREIARKQLAPGYEYIDTVPKGEVDVVQRIEQKYCVVESSQHVRAVLDLIADHQVRVANQTTSAGEAPLAPKVIVFLPTTKLTSLYASLFTRLRRCFPHENTPIYDIHSERAQRSRERMSQQFRQHSSGPAVLLTSDVSARGVDYPNVGLVIQVGPPQNRDLYVHRIGRTGRAGKGGEAVLLLRPYEKSFATQQLGSKVPIVACSPQELVDRAAITEEQETARRAAVASACRHVDGEHLSLTFRSLAGALIGRAGEFDAAKRTLIDDLENWFRSFERDDLPMPPLPAAVLMEGGGRRGGGGGGGGGGSRFGGMRRRSFEDEGERRPRSFDRSSSSSYGGGSSGGGNGGEGFRSGGFGRRPFGDRFSGDRTAGFSRGGAGGDRSDRSDRFDRTDRPPRADRDASFRSRGERSEAKSWLGRGRVSRS